LQRQTAPCSPPARYATVSERRLGPDRSPSLEFPGNLYLPNAKWCDLPELPIPVEPDWWCRLWKI